MDESQVRPYFELSNVLHNGVFYAAHELYGITFKERKDIPVYHPDVRVFEVFDADGSPLALWYFDYYKRDNKNGGAWEDVLINQSQLLGMLPVVYNVCNFAKPAPGQPALIGYDEVTGIFHEFGHGLHRMFSNVRIRPCGNPGADRLRRVPLAGERSGPAIRRFSPITQSTTRPGSPCRRVGGED